MRTLHQAFDPRNNALNAVRLALALGVIFWHSYPLSGRDISFGPAREIMAEVWVDGFFAISGFLIVRSWTRRPDVRAYLKARVLRIFPAFWACLVVTSFATAPIGMWLATGDASLTSLTRENFGYIYKNFSLLVFQTGINGTPLEVPYPGKWNSSLWTLPYEFICYLGVMTLGVLGLLSKRFTLVILLGCAELAMLVTATGMVDNFFILSASRFALMFISGAVIYRYSDRIPANWWIVGAAAALPVLSTFLVDYRLLAAVPLAYTMITSGALITTKRLNFENDFSYGAYIYAFPVQQLLVVAGLGQANVVVLALASICLTAPFAVASWYCIEKPILARRRRAKSLPALTPSAVPA